MKGLVRLSTYFLIAIVLFIQPKILNAKDRSELCAKVDGFMDKLKEGEVVMIKIEDKEYNGKAGFILLDETPDKIFAVITDYKSMPEYMPKVKATKIVAEEDGMVDVFFDTKVAFLRNKYYVIHLLDKNKRFVSWHLDEKKKNDIKKMDGFWQICPLEKKTVLIYANKVLPGGFVPGFVANWVSGGMIEDVLEAVKNRLKKLKNK